MFGYRIGNNLHPMVTHTEYSLRELLITLFRILFVILGNTDHFWYRDGIELTENLR